MRRREYGGDYIGFTFNGVHSSELGIVRVSDGSRYTKDLLPPFKDKTVAVPGGDGSYYFGSQYNERTFPVQFAFDSLKEEEISALTNLFSDKGVHELIFDEIPYKKYMVKVTSQPKLKFICFDENYQRIYKGEGDVTFTAFYPFGISTFKQLNDSPYRNKREWSLASGMLESLSAEGYDKPFSGNGLKEIKLYNPGDMDAEFELFIKANNGFGNNVNINLNIIADAGIHLTERLNLGPITLRGDDIGIVIKTKEHLIQGIKMSEDTTKEYEYTNNIYNSEIISGNFFKIPTNNSIKQKYPRAKSIKMELSIVSQLMLQGKIEYNYLYF